MNKKVGFATHFLAFATGGLIGAFITLIMFLKNIGSH